MSEGRKPSYRTATTARRVDANQQAIIDALHAAGWLTVDVSGLGRGMADLIAFAPDGRVMLVECKAVMKFTPAELDFMVYLVTDAYRVIGSPEQVIERLRV